MIQKFITIKSNEQASCLTVRQVHTKPKTIMSIIHAIDSMHCASNKNMLKAEKSTIGVDYIDHMKYICVHNMTSIAITIYQHLFTADINMYYLLLSMLY